MADMLRKLLTLLAILSGLTALGTPAQARLAALDGIQLEATGDRAAACESGRIAHSKEPRASLFAQRVQAPACPRPTVTVIIPTVQLGVDRARE